MHKGGTYVCMEGPAFSTRAESHLYRSWGAHIIGMTNLQEAKLAREAEICYATIALVTDYDCWHPDHDHVTVEMIIDNLTQNARTAQRVIAGGGHDPRGHTAHVRLRARARDRDHHATRRRARGHAPEARAHHGEVPEHLASGPSASGLRPSLLPVAGARRLAGPDPGSRFPVPDS